jgi:ferrous iron transport protein A
MLFHPSQPNTSQIDTLAAPTLSFRLDEVPINKIFMIEAIVPTQATANASFDLSNDLESLGFLPNEQVELLACAPFSGDPLLVRVGLSKFALRRAEAACIRVRAL